MLRVVDVDYIKDYELLVTFNDGSKKNVDLKPYLTGEVFGELLDKDKFIKCGKCEKACQIIVDPVEKSNIQ